MSQEPYPDGWGSGHAAGFDSRRGHDAPGIPPGAAQKESTMNARYTGIDSGTRWTMRYLHLVGHPVAPGTYYQALALRNSGSTVEEAVAILEVTSS